jgi:hypothetical protein
MQLIDDATQLFMLRSVGAEEINAGAADFAAAVEIEYQPASPGDAIMDSATVRVTCRSVDVPGIGIGSLLMIRSEYYRIVSNQPDGQGMTQFLCELA